jgi:hypothetical protein
MNQAVPICIEQIRQLISYIYVLNESRRRELHNKGLEETSIEETGKIINQQEIKHFEV